MDRTVIIRDYQGKIKSLDLLGFNKEEFDEELKEIEERKNKILEIKKFNPKFKEKK